MNFFFKDKKSIIEKKINKLKANLIEFERSPVKITDSNDIVIINIKKFLINIFSFLNLFK